MGPMDLPRQRPTAVNAYHGPVLRPQTDRIRAHALISIASPARVFIGVWLGLAAGCAQLPEHPDLPPRLAMTQGSDTHLDRMMSAAEAQHPGASGFRLVVEGMEAFVIRMQSARVA